MIYLILEKKKQVIQISTLVSSCSTLINLEALNLSKFNFNGLAIYEI